MTPNRNTHRWLAGSGLVLLALAGLGCSAENAAHPPIDDVDPSWACTTGDDGVLRATGSVTNQSSKPSFYLVTVEFAHDGRSFHTVIESIDDVDPGETVQIEASVADPPHGDTSCFVSDVERFKA